MKIMKHRFLSAAILVALSAPALADRDSGDGYASGKGPGHNGHRGVGKILHRLDTDGDRQISRDEFQPPPNPMFRNADIDGDGQITMAEIEQHIAQRREERRLREQEFETRMQERFSAMDIDGDGAVTSAETQQAAFNEMDSNDDGFISGDEFRPSRQEHRRRDRHRDHRQFD